MASTGPVTIDGEDCTQAKNEIGRIGIGVVAKGVATGVIEVGQATPFVAPLFLALRSAKRVIDTAAQNADDLKELHALCVIITEQVVDRCIGALEAGKAPPMDISPLTECVNKLKRVAERYKGRGMFSKLARYRRDGDDISRLRKRIDALVPILGLSASVQISGQVDDVRKLLEQMDRRLSTQTLQPPAPAQGAPWIQSWQVVVDILGRKGRPRVFILGGVTIAGLGLCCAIGGRHLFVPRGTQRTA